MIEHLANFAEKYYIDPIRQGTGYNFVNSITYALIFIGIVYLLFLLLKRDKIPIDKRFVLAIFPYAILGSCVRLFEDTGLVKSYFLITPMIYVIGIAFVSILFAISRLLEKKFNVPYFKTMLLIPIILIPVLLSFLDLVNIKGLLLVLAFYLPWIIIFSFVKWGIGNKLVALAQIFDATTSAVSISFFNFFEQHPIPRFLSNINPVIYIVVKAAVVIGILILIDRFSKEKDFNTYLKLIIGILGAAFGFRNLLSLLVMA